MATLHSSVARPDGGNSRRIAVMALAVLQVLVPILPSLGLGIEVGERSDAAHTLITPAGWAFSIWGLLYAGSLVYAVYQTMPAQRGNPLLARIGWPSAGAFLGNALWALYTQSFGLNAGSVAIIVFTLGCLLAVTRSFARAPGFTPGELALTVAPLSALSGWLTAATIVNIAASLQFHGIELAPGAAAAMLVAGGAFAAGVLAWGRGNFWYALPFLWALAAVHAEGGRANATIGTAAIIAALLVLASAVILMIRRENRERRFRAA